MANLKMAKWMSGVAVCGLMTGLGAAAPAAAQGGEGASRDEIIVSARKTAESIEDAPISVSAITANQLRDQDLFSVDDIARFAPGLSFSKAFGRSGDRPVVRGQSNVLANVQFGVESGTAYFVDGIYYPSTIQSLDLGLVKQVEVIRGPQSALYGRNTYAGAINFITVDPSTDGLSVKLRGRAATGGEKQIGGSASAPVIPGVLGLLVSGSYYEYDGQYTNTLTNKKIGQEESWNGSAIVTFTPAENLKAKARVTYQQDNDGSIPLFLQGSAENNCLPGFRSNYYRGGGTLNAGPGGTNRNQYFCGVIEPDTIALNTDAIGPAANQQDGTAFDGIERDLLVAGLTVDWEAFDGFTLSSLTGYRTETERFGSDSDHSDANIFAGPPTLAFALVNEPLFANTTRSEIRDWSQEVRANWEPIERLRLMAGGFYYYQEDKGTEITKTSGEAGVLFGGPSGDPGCGAAATCSDRATVKNWAVFGLAEFGITDTLRLTGEVRYMEETKGLVQYNGLGVITFPASPAVAPASNTENYTTPRITLDWQARDNLLLYAVFAQGVKPGGFNGSAGASVGQATYLPEKANSYELGFKTQLWDGKFTINAAGYYLDATDVQLTTAVPSSTTAVNSIATNQGQGRIWGAEAEFFLSPNENWDFTATYAYTDPRFTEGCDQDQYIFTSGGGVFFGENDPRNTSFNSVFGGTASCDISGKKYPLVSTHMASGSATYHRPVGVDMEFFAGANATYESSKFTQVHNLAETGDAFILGAQFGVRGDHWQANVFGRNLTDEDTIAIATRWFDLRYGNATTAPAPARIAADGGTATQGLANSITTGSPRGFFGSLRRPLQIGIEFSYEF